MNGELKTTAFWILLGLVDGRRHGYSIIEEVRKLSDGDVQLKVPTLYGSLDRLERDGLVAADGEEAVDGRLRRYFRLTDAGDQALRAAVDRMEASTRTARSHLSPSTRTAIA